MPSRKRKSIATESDTEGDDTPPIKGKSKRKGKGKASRRISIVTTTAPPSKKRAPSSAEAEVSGYAAKLATLEYTVIQIFNCQWYKRKGIIDSPLPERCTSCTEKQSILGGCRFVNMRAFRKDSSGTVDYADYAFRSNLDMPGRVVAKKARPLKPAPGSATSRSKRRLASRPITPTTKRSSIIKPTLTPEELKAEADYILHLIAPAFAEQLRCEKRHESAHLGLPAEGKQLPGGARPLIRILSIPETRSLCDNCATSIYLGGYLCGCCGKELCLHCWEEWEPSATRGANSRLHRIDTCSRHRCHIRDSMVFMTRAKEGEVVKLLERVEARIPSAGKQAQETIDAGAEIESIPTCQPTWPNTELKYLATPKTHHTSITLQQFRSLWRRGGIPLVLTGFLDRFGLSWDPQYFIQQHGSESCYVHNCDDGVVMETTVGAFFTKFDSPDTTDSYKLKDWPPSTEFSTAFPKLFEDFENALPFPTYTARKGTLNLAAHFPEGYNAPDLGPKMYNAYPAPDFLPDLSKDGRSSARAVKGTTNLHLDLTDAMNIMLFSAGGTRAPASATEPKDIPFCGAIWDIFPPSASTHLRAYLNSEAYLAAHKHEGAVKQDDPIHRQLYYLTEADLITLYKDYEVMSYRIYQEPGEAVFIPAGCAHQVRNRKSCVKVAVDFLTPENVIVCKGLVEEGRLMGDPFKGRPGQGKEDVLQLWTCLGFAWEVFDKQPEVDGVGLKGDEGDGSMVGGSRGEEGKRDTVMGKNTEEQKLDIVENSHGGQPSGTEVKPLDEESVVKTKAGSKSRSRGRNSRKRIS